MANIGNRSRGYLPVREHLTLVIAGALLLVSGLGGAHSQEMGEQKSQVPEVTQEFTKELESDPDAVLIQVLKKDATVDYLAGPGASDSGVYAPDQEAVGFSGACDDKAECDQKFGNEDYIWITARISKRALGASAEAPITRVIPGLVVQVGGSSCWWSCSGPGGSSQCQCRCTADGQPPTSCPQ